MSGALGEDILIMNGAAGAGIEAGNGMTGAGMELPRRSEFGAAGSFVRFPQKQKTHEC